MGIKISAHTKSPLVLEKTDCAIRDTSVGLGQDVFIPNNIWVKQTEKNLVDQFTVEKKKFSESITVIDVDPYIRKLYHDKIWPLLLGNDSDVRSKVLKNYVEEVCKRIESFSKIKLDRLYSYELIYKPTGQNSTAYDYSNERPIGLHIDTHNVKDLKNRSKGFQLLTINLGTEDRYFYFINYNVKDIFTELKSILAKKELEEIDSAKKLKDKFLQNVTTPVYKLTTAPDQAYIAVTQNIIHDGGTNMHKQQDIALLIGGYFSWV